MPLTAVLRRLPLALACAAAVLAASDARALTTPMSGATLWPASAPLSLPFPAGSSVQITSGYGPTAGSSLHRNITDATHGNDHYALDLIYAGRADGGRGMPIAAAAAGTVVKAGWATGGWSNFGIRVILRHDLGDGHVYHSLYAHLNALASGLEVGDTVTRGEVIGELGGSCMEALSCGSFSTPHLHFSVHRDSLIGGSGTGGSYGGNAVVPEAIDGYEDLMRGQVVTSMNTAGTECGDGFCTGGETHASCAVDCPICQSIPPAGRAVDEAELCFSRGGDASYWREESDGWEGSLIWTHAIDGPVDNHGVWDLTFDEAGEYRLEVYTDGAWAHAQQAEYQVAHAGGTDRVIVDQSAVDGWQQIGTFHFAAGGGQSVRLDDATGEPFSLRRQIVFDAVRLSRLDAPPLVDGGSAPIDAGVPSDDAAIIGYADAGSGGSDDGGGRGTVEAGCGCRAGGARRDVPGALWAIGMLTLLVSLRRRRRAR